MTYEEIIKKKMRNPRSKEEMNRRLELTKKMMWENDIDMVLAQNDNKYLGGFVRWLIDIPAVQAYPMTVMFEKDGSLTTITHGAPDQPLLPEWALRYPAQRLSSAYIRTLDYTKQWDSTLIVKKIKEKNIKRLGFIGDAMINHVIYDDIREQTDTELISITKEVDKIKGPKSKEEIEQGILATAQMQDEVMKYIAKILKPGMKEYELHAEVVKMLLEYGSEEQLVMVGSAPYNECASIQYEHYQNRTIEKGDAVTVMVETSGPGGYYCEIARPYIVDGKPCDDLVRLFEQSKIVQNRTAELLKPGMVAGQITTEINKLLKELNLPEDKRIFTHGQGYDLIEAPGFAEIDDTILQENMNIAVHPTYVTEHAFAFCCDNYLVTKNGGKRVSQFPQEIVII